MVRKGWLRLPELASFPYGATNSVRDIKVRSSSVSMVGGRWAAAAIGRPLRAASLPLRPENEPRWLPTAKRLGITPLQLRGLTRASPKRHARVPTPDAARGMSHPLRPADLCELNERLTRAKRRLMPRKDPNRRRPTCSLCGACGDH